MTERPLQTQKTTIKQPDPPEAIQQVKARLAEVAGRAEAEQRAETAEGERDALREALKQIVDADFLKVEGVRQPIWVRWNHALAIAKATLHTGGCNGLARGDGNGQGADGVVYPGDPAHCLSCALQPSKEER